MLLADSYAQSQTMFNALPADKQAAFKAVFDGTDVMGTSQNAGMWLAENEDDEDALAEAMNKIKSIMASCPNSDQDVI